MIVQRAIEEAGIPTILIAALPPVARQNGTPRAVAPRVPMGANAGEPNNPEMQRNIVKDALRHFHMNTLQKFNIYSHLSLL